MFNLLGFPLSWLVVRDVLMSESYVLHAQVCSLEVVFALDK